ncbi:MAG: hypothetical protein GY913_22135 [Proteobacteria bacterium]|nr:hypothetical protein [Pseudomonadota bacterium]MCP4919611.1 hypothetical protein [Pseudomonadota bacterium]
MRRRVGVGAVIALAAGLVLWVARSEQPAPVEVVEVVEDAPAPIVLFQTGEVALGATHVRADDRVLFEHDGHTVGLHGALDLETWTLEHGHIALDTTTPFALRLGDVELHGQDARLEATFDGTLRLFVERGLVRLRRGDAWVEVTAGWPDGQIRERLDELLHQGVWTPPEPETPVIVAAPPIDLAELRSRLVFGDESVHGELTDHLARSPSDAEAWALLAKAERMRGDGTAELAAWTAITELPRGAHTATARFEVGRLADDAEAVRQLRALLDDGAGALEPEARLELGRRLLAQADPAASAVLDELIASFPGTAAATAAEKLRQP